MTQRRGMTLVEVMVTMVIAGLMAAAGTEAFSSIIDHRNIIMTASSTVERAGALREQLHSWLTSGTIMTPAAAIRAAGLSSSTIQISQLGIGGQLVQSVSPAVITGDDINFTTFAPNPTQSATCIMRLFIDDDLNTPERGLTLEYKVTTASPLMRVQLDTTVAFMTVDYLDNTTLQWVSTANAATITPKAVRIMFSDSLGTNGLLAVPILIPMMAPAAAGAAPAGGAGG